MNKVLLNIEFNPKVKALYAQGVVPESKASSARLRPEFDRTVEKEWLY